MPSPLSIGLFASNRNGGLNSGLYRSDPRGPANAGRRVGNLAKVADRIALWRVGPQLGVRTHGYDASAGLVGLPADKQPMPFVSMALRMGKAGRVLAGINIP